MGEIAGLSPRRARRDGGEVPGADVDLIDALPRYRTWPTVASWLLAARSAVTRRGYLADLAAFLRWRDAHMPGVELLDVDQDAITAYAESLAAGTARAGVRAVGTPLGAATVARRLSTLSSVFAHAMRRAGLDRNPAAPDRITRPVVSPVGRTPARSRTDAALLLAATEDPAFIERYPADAAAVALLMLCAPRAVELGRLAAGDVVRSGGHLVLLVTRKGGRTDQIPVPNEARPLIERLITDRPGAALVFVRDDGRPWDRWRFTTALRRAADHAGVDRKQQLTPHTARATVATQLLDSGVPIDVVQEALGHASPDTTQRYNRGERRLAGHGAYQMAALLSRPAGREDPTS